ncbi:MAG: hypothetical protein H6590_03155 [Flavobacteriales bacterium]|nr:hypothetical protein [Flavobacteriales bacterium]
MSWYRATGNICGPAYGGSLTQITGACHDNIGGGNNMPRINSSTSGITLTAGETIYIRVWNRETNAYFYHGTFSICVTPNNPPPNDNPCGAIALEVGGGECILFPTTNENATNTGASFPPTGSTVPALCGAPPANYLDVWYTVEVPLSVSGTNALIIDTDDVLPLNFAMAAYRDVSGTGCPTLLTLTAVGACSTAGSTQGTPPNATMPRLSLVPPTITPGETLYIRVWTEVNNQQGPFSICAQTANPPDCTGTFYDSGGAAGQYQNSESQIRSHCAEKAGDVVTLNFTQFSLESGYDFIRIYNQASGPPNGANLIGSFTGTSIPNQISGTSTPSNPNGCLLVVFSADNVITAAGYTYKVSCGPPAIIAPGTCSVTAYTPGALPNTTTSYDPGGAGGTTYPGNLGVAAAGIAPYHARFCPSTAGDPVTLDFTSFQVESNFDALYVFNADILPGAALNTPAVLATQINSGNPAQLEWSGLYNPPNPPNGGYWGSGGPGTVTATINAANPNGCLTLVFYSDAIVSGSGWEATVSCGPPPPPPPPTPCDGMGPFYETVGGSTGNYANNVSATQTFCAIPGYILTATFTQFNTEANWDKMYVFDGPTTASPMIASANGPGFGPAPYGAGSYWGTGIPGPFTSSTPGGCLTFVFVSDASVVRTGWVAKLSCAAQAPNDNPCNPTGATLITPGSSCVPQTFNNTSTTPTTGPPLPGCGNYQGGDVWFRFVAPPSGRVYIDTHAGTLTDAAMALYSSVNCSGPFTLMECDDDDGEGLMPAIDRMCSPLTPGQTYWLRVWGYGNRRGTFDLCIVEGSGNTTNQTDCGGAFSLCTSTPFSGIAYGNGCGPDLVPTNWGCLAGERQGSWYAFRTNAAGSLGMTITPSVPADIDWAIWQGNIAGTPNPVGGSCLPAGAPVRCSFASRANTMATGGANPTAATGMGRATFTGAASYAAVTPVQNDAVDGWVPGINVAANQMYLLFVDDHHLNGASYNVTWTESPGALIGCEILPVEALQLEAAPQVRTVDLVWTTTREQNSSHFIIERSTDGVHFTAIGRMNAVGNAESLTSYQGVDDAPVVGLNYYRLQQVDMDGTIAVSNTVTALFKPNTTTVMVVPNPALDQAELLMSAAYEGSLRVRIMDGSGRIVANFLAPEGMQRMELPIANLEGGSYTVQLLTEKGEPHARTRFVKH